MADGTDEFDNTGTPPPSLLSGPGRSFMGKPLAPYSYARRLLWRSLFNGGMEAADQIFSLGLIFALAVTETQARDYLFDSKRFKADFMAWLDVGKPDYKVVVALANAILEEANKTEVKAVEDHDPLAKKNGT